MPKPDEENKDDFQTEDEVIPADVLKVMEKSGIGNDDVEPEPEPEPEPESEPKSEPEPEPEPKDKEGDTEPIPQEQINIARRLGWSDDYIVEVSNNNPEILEDMVTLAGRQIQQPQVETKVEPAPKEKQEVTEVAKVELDDAALKKMKESYGDEVVNSVILPLMKGLNTTIGELNTLRGNVDGVERTNQATQAKKNFDEANTVFDGLTETFTVFGKTDELPRTTDGKYDANSPAVQARTEIFDVANAFKASGMSWTDSLKNAVRWYKGEHAEKSLERKIVKDLKGRTKKFSPRPTSKKTTKTFVSREDEGTELVREVYKK